MIRYGMRMQDGSSVKSRRRNAFTIWKNERMNNETEVVREKTNERRLVHYSRFVIRISSF